MLTVQKEQNYQALFRGQTGIVMSMANRHALYYGFKFIVLGKSTEHFCASSEAQSYRNLCSIIDLVLV